MAVLWFHCVGLITKSVIINFPLSLLSRYKGPWVASLLPAQSFDKPQYFLRGSLCEYRLQVEQAGALDHISSRGWFLVNMVYPVPCTLYPVPCLPCYHAAGLITALLEVRPASQPGSERVNHLLIVFSCSADTCLPCLDIALFTTLPLSAPQQNSDYQSFSDFCFVSWITNYSNHICRYFHLGAEKKKQKAWSEVNVDNHARQASGDVGWIFYKKAGVASVKGDAGC